VVEVAGTRIDAYTSAVRPPESKRVAFLLAPQFNYLLAVYREQKTASTGIIFVHKTQNVVRSTVDHLHLVMRK